MKGGLDTAAKVVISLYPQDFLKFVKDHKLTDIYVVDRDDPFVVGKNIVMKSKCGYFFAATYDNAICFIDPMGYSDLESLDESIENNSFYAINQIKDKDHSAYWSNDTGKIYRLLSEAGYDDETKIKRAYRFLEGNIDILTYNEFENCEDKAKEGGFRTLSELCVSKDAGFKNKVDYDEAKELKAPDAQSLEAHRFLEEIQLELDYDNISESLLAGVIMYLATGSGGTEDGEVFIDLNKIYHLYRHWQPEKPSDEFNRFKNEEDVEAFLQSSKGRLIGYYSPSNKQYQYSLARIYVDGANVSFKGAKSGDGSRGLKYPDIQVLKGCYNQLQNESFGPVKIIIDGNVAKHILNEDTKNNVNTFKELNQSGKLEATLMGETADDALIRKIKDDPQAYVVVNDDYSKDHNLTGRDLEHIINVSFLKDKPQFYGTGYENLKKMKGLFSKWKGRGVSLFHLRKLGMWPYGEGWFDPFYVSDGCCR